VPTQWDGYVHVATEVWHNLHGAEKVLTHRQCDCSGEDPTCANSEYIPSIADHTTYLGIPTNCSGIYPLYKSTKSLLMLSEDYPSYES